MYKLPEMGGGGGVIRAMPERKHSLFWEVFPYSDDVFSPISPPDLFIIVVKITIASHFNYM